MGIPSMNRVDDSGYYDGSRVFSWLSEPLGLSVDQINFLLSQFTAVGAAFAFRYHLHNSKVAPETRHGAALLLGLIMVVFCFGRQALHLACLSSISYAILMTASPKISQRLVLITSMLYLSLVHIKRQYYSYNSYTLDISGPLMVLTQKVTSLAFSLHDGLARKPEDLTPFQKQQLIRKVPNPLEYYSYVFHFHAVMVGPTVLFADYTDFINGKHFSKRSVEEKTSKEAETETLEDESNCVVAAPEPSAVTIVFQKLFFSLLCAGLFVKLTPMFLVTRVKDDDFVENTSLVGKTFFILLSTTIARMKYYHAWLLADAICNASGLGFNGYTASGKAKWDLISNVDILKFEFGLSLRDSIDNWNKFTNRWLRFVVYERTGRFQTVLTYCLSAMWHGFYPGYYITFLGGALCTLASRAVRRSVRPFFLKNRATHRFYDVLTFITTRIVMAYLTFSFVLLELWPSIRLLAHMYFWIHLLSLAAIFLLPKLLPPPKPNKEQLEQQRTSVIGNPSS
ncbi:lysophospholipid acyltransferase 1 [Daphnia magna]|uniref:lysophospholipid acyltransferase 1 n=1 Tax=Daphnia magna TaxID=35525 RepID=UPI001E1BDD98|nr:lysophospholipid acyltransferase 1 [Daphnia magna]XP_045026033.1 lysophospholipid acyltransferase 1 [Daphnia magna]XP_045026035.1 lysophospholipid acyltransferase 1 [Daphnia magna]XP_045026036.1 lysophospholipid acyltransferase 1 [Daphnia magna]XP_045026037.1 lysophospholipid acyltransferase 1 [Daphnia magna]XP_045026038.1 lysophospholipid acyltransferase 1 [Daphnia magna]XP_045026039.1 lysophospholipid acyltransferase 1 [Daphnia magna]XP_045026040.1 lysophospholipid acyltransferase 1 [Da